MKKFFAKASFTQGVSIANQLSIKKQSTHPTWNALFLPFIKCLSFKKRELKQQNDH